jgi:choice-of-anchor B domain-containing protein
MRTIFTFLAFIAITTFGHSQNYNLTQVGYLDITGIRETTASDIWGWVDSEGNEYAIIGLKNGTSIIDVTDPSNPVEVFFEPGLNSIWRDIKTWNNHAYVTTEAKQGLLIIDLSTLPGDTNLSTSYYTPDGTNGGLDMSAHNLFIDENGICYIFGANRDMGGCIMLDLADPKNPVEVGKVENWYVHDGVAKNNRLFLANINVGFFSIFDITDKTNPVLLGVRNTPNNFTHNLWFSDDLNYVYTTDEVSGAYLGEYDVSDPGAITETDRIRTTTGTDVIPHNTHFINNFIVTSYYRDGVIIHDVSQKGNMIEVARFDTSPFLSGNGFNGCWGAYPWLPSGNILASDIERGLFVLSSDYKRGCYLEGNVTDIATGNSISNVKLEILTTPIKDSTSLSGEYRSGYGIAGTYSVRFSHPSYTSKTINNVEILHGEITRLDVQLGVAVSTTGNPDLDLDVYPNPFSDEILIKTADTNLHIKVYNILGDIVLEQKIIPGNSVKFPERTANGIYLVRVFKKEDIVLTKKMLKE